jgi:hypothetical protein
MSKLFISMKLIDILEDMEDVSNPTYTEVYRGQNHEHVGESIWVSEDEEFASEYGEVTKYLMPTNLNIIDAQYDYSEWEALVSSFDPMGDYEEYMYEPTPEFIQFLRSKGYDGIENGLNILIIDKTNLKQA